MRASCHIALHEATGRRHEVGRFTIEPDGALTGPLDYMEAKGIALVDRILAGDDVVFNMTSQRSPDNETAILVRLQTDFANWKGTKDMLAGLRPRGARERGRRRARDIERKPPRIYVADLAAYNAGKLHGAWIDATLPPDEIQERIDAMLRAGSGGEDWAIHDTEGFGDARVDELNDVEKISKIAEAIVEHGPVFAGVLAYKGDVDDALEAMTESYQGEHDSLGDWAYDVAKDTGELDQIPERFQNYVDWERYGEEMDMSGDIFTVEVGNKVHVFLNQ